MIQFIVKMPHPLDINDLPTGIQDKADEMSMQWQSDQIPNSRVNQGKKLVLGVADTDAQGLQDFLDEWSLPWDIIVTEVVSYQDGVDELGEPIIISVGGEVSGDSILDWMSDEPVINQNGEITGYQRPTTVRPICSYAGRPTWVIT